MKLRLVTVFLALIFAVVACAPTLVEREIDELISPHPYSETFELVLNAINTQPYPSNSGGWVVVQSDQVGGFVSAELDYTVWRAFQGVIPQKARVTVTLVDREDGRTAVNLGLSMGDEYAAALANRIRGRIGL